MRKFLLILTLLLLTLVACAKEAPTSTSAPGTNGSAYKRTHSGPGDN
ncbi:MAG: hypothetical protein M5U34_41040 [Chloroflexi bacterium]|nr:hypothetical protein [Chloroflexota bacterium]